MIWISLVFSFYLRCSYPSWFIRLFYSAWTSDVTNMKWTHIALTRRWCIILSYSLFYAWILELWKIFYYVLLKRKPRRTAVVQVSCFIFILFFYFFKNLVPKLSQGFFIFLDEKQRNEVFTEHNFAHKTLTKQTGEVNMS